MKRYDFEHGIVVRQDNVNLKIYVDCPEDGKTEISGFRSITEMTNFIMFGDFDPYENTFNQITGSQLNLEWK